MLSKHAANTFNENVSKTIYQKLLKICKDRKEYPIQGHFVVVTDRRVRDEYDGRVFPEMGESKRCASFVEFIWRADLTDPIDCDGIYYFDERNFNYEFLHVDGVVPWARENNGFGMTQVTLRFKLCAFRVGEECKELMEEIGFDRIYYIEVDCSKACIGTFAEDFPDEVTRFVCEYIDAGCTGTFEMNPEQGTITLLK